MRLAVCCCDLCIPAHKSRWCCCQGSHSHACPSCIRCIIHISTIAEAVRSRSLQDDSKNVPDVLPPLSVLAAEVRDFLSVASSLQASMSFDIMPTLHQVLVKHCQPAKGLARSRAEAAARLAGVGAQPPNSGGSYAAHCPVQACCCCERCIRQGLFTYRTCGSHHLDQPT